MFKISKLFLASNKSVTWSIIITLVMSGHKKWRIYTLKIIYPLKDSVETNWTDCKITVKQSVDKFIPQKQVKSLNHSTFND